MTSLGGVFIAFYYNNLLPTNAFSINRSIDIILAPIVGGLGTLLGPIVGAFILTPVGEGLIKALERLGIEVPGAKQIFYGLVLLAIIWFLPGGIWPALVHIWHARIRPALLRVGHALARRLKRSAGRG